MVKKATIFDALNPLASKVSPEIKNLRLDVCKSCEFFLKNTSRCSKCGCFMHLKTEIPHAECPIGLWGKVN